jgi:hypothetical protein
VRSARTPPPSPSFLRDRLPPPGPCDDPIPRPLVRWRIQERAPPQPEYQSRGAGKSERPPPVPRAKVRICGGEDNLAPPPTITAGGKSSADSGQSADSPSTLAVSPGNRRCTGPQRCSASWSPSGPEPLASTPATEQALGPLATAGRTVPGVGAGAHHGTKTSVPIPVGSVWRQNHLEVMGLAG